jgi:hypothetical protein
MSTLRVNQITFNDAGNASVSIANSWNISIVSGGTEVGQFRNNGDFVANNRIFFKSGGSTEVALNTSIEAANSTAIAAFAKANTAAINNSPISASTLTATRAYMNLVSVADGSSITLDMNLGNNFNVTLGGARTLANPTNTTIGQSGIIFISQNTSGGSTLAYGNNWRFSGNTAPTLTSGANTVDALVYFVRASGSIFAQMTSNVG